MTIRERARIFHQTRQIGHPLRIERKRKVKMNRMKELKAITTKMEIESKGKNNMMMVRKDRTVMEKKQRKEKKVKNSMKKVKHKNKTMVKKASKNKTMAKRVRRKTMVMSSTDGVTKGCYNK